jgi:hypothetical protein
MQTLPTCRLCVFEQLQHALQAVQQAPLLVRRLGCHNTLNHV